MRLDRPAAALIVVAAVSAAGVRAAPAKTDLERDELAGPVKTVTTTWRANHKNAEGEVEERGLGSRTYDRHGMLLVDRETTADFARVRVPERRSPNETVFRSKMGDSLERVVFDTAGNIAERREWYQDTADGPPNMLSRMRYDSAGRMISLESFDEQNASLDLTLYVRDEHGRVIVEEDRPRDRRAPYPRMHYTYTLDSHGNWVERDVRRENVSEDDYDYRYAGNLIRTIVYY